MGILSYATTIPALSKKRLERLASSGDEVVKAAVGELPRPTSVPPKYWAGKLHESIDGVGLSETHRSKSSSRWLQGGTRLLRGASFIQAVKIRLGLVATPARSARGRDTSSQCKLGCGQPGTIHHILQVCPRVQPWRITRHNAIMDLTIDRCRKAGYQVLKEPHIPTSRGTRIPDITCWRGEEAYVIDVQVCGDANAIQLAEAHLMKVDKYKVPEVLVFVQDRAGMADPPTVSSVTTNWRGIIAPETELLLRRMKITDLAELIVVRTLRGSASVYANYMGMTGGGDVT